MSDRPEKQDQKQTDNTQHQTHSEPTEREQKPTKSLAEYIQGQPDRDNRSEDQIQVNTDQKQTSQDNNAAKQVQKQEDQNQDQVKELVNTETNLKNQVQKDSPKNDQDQEKVEALSVNGAVGAIEATRQESNKKTALENAQWYDFLGPRHTTNNGFTDSMLHMVKCSLSVGVLGMHEAYMVCGIWTAMGITVFLSLLIGLGTCMLLSSAQKMYGRVEEPQLTYPVLAEKILAQNRVGNKKKYFKFLIEFTISFYLFVTCSVMTTLVARNLKALVEGVTTISEDGQPPLNVYILTLMVPFGVVSWMTDLKVLAPFNVVAAIYTVVVTMVTIYYGVTQTRKALDQFPIFTSTIGLFDFIGICMFSLDGITVALPIENTMANPQRFHLIVIASMPIISMCIILVGFFGSWAFWEEAVTPIIINFPYESLSIMLKIFLCLIIFVQYSIDLSIAHQFVWQYLKNFHQRQEYRFWERFYRSLTVFLITLFAFAFPDVHNLMGFLGSVCVSTLVLIFPAVMEILVYKEHPGFGRCHWRLWKCICLITIGTIIMTISIYIKVNRLIKNYPHR